MARGRGRSRSGTNTKRTPARNKGAAAAQAPTGTTPATARGAQAAAETVHVKFDCTRPETHLVRVTMEFPPGPGGPEAALAEPGRTMKPGPDDRAFRMAAWVPGSYKLYDFGRHVQDVSAKVAGRKAEVVQTHKDEWTVRGAAGKSVSLTYDVYCRDLTVDTSHVTSDHAHLYPATLLLYDPASRPLRHSVALKLPKGWRAWSGLEAAPGGRFDGRQHPADNYDQFIDCPIECGPPEDYHVLTFDVRGVPHRFVCWMPPDRPTRGVTGASATGRAGTAAGASRKTMKGREAPLVDWQRIERDFHAVASETIKVWGDVPYEHYTFLGHVALDHGGGLEHRNSTVLGIDPLHLQSDEKIKQRLIPLVIHEFFHTWNVKRVLPAVYQPYQLQHEQPTGLLWLFEGFTSYYEIPVLHRAGIVDEDGLGKYVGELVELYEKVPGRNRRSAADASRLTWTLLYQPHEHNINRNISYYTRGAFVGLCLDAHLRRKGVRGGLDVVMKHLWRKHGKVRGRKPGARPGVGGGAGDPDAPAGLAEGGFGDVVLEATGVDCRALLRKWTETPAELPIDQAMHTLGWDVKRDWKDDKKKNGLGVFFKKDSFTIERIPETAPAWKVLQPDDELVALEGYRWVSGRLADLAAERKPGSTVEIAVFREGRLRAFDVPLQEMPKEKITVKPRKGATAARHRKAWLGKPATKKPRKRSAANHRRKRHDRRATGPRPAPAANLPTRSGKPTRVGARPQDQAKALRRTA